MKASLSKSRCVKARHYENGYCDAPVWDMTSHRGTAEKPFVSWFESEIYDGNFIAPKLDDDLARRLNANTRLIERYVA